MYFKDSHCKSHSKWKKSQATEIFDKKLESFDAAEWSSQPVNCEERKPWEGLFSLFCGPIFTSLSCCNTAGIQCFDAVGWLSGGACDLWKLSDEVVAWLSVWNEVQLIWAWPSWCHCHPHPILLYLNGLTFLTPSCSGCPWKETIIWVSVMYQHNAAMERIMLLLFFCFFFYVLHAGTVLKLLKQLSNSKCGMLVRQSVGRLQKLW